MMQAPVKAGKSGQIAANGMTPPCTSDQAASGPLALKAEKTLRRKTILHRTCPLCI